MYLLPRYPFIILNSLQGTAIFAFFDLKWKVYYTAWEKVTGRPHPHRRKQKAPPGCLNCLRSVLILILQCPMRKVPGGLSPSPPLEVSWGGGGVDQGSPPGRQPPGHDRGSQWGGWQVLQGSQATGGGAWGGQDLPAECLGPAEAVPGNPQ